MATVFSLILNFEKGLFSRLNDSRCNPSSRGKLSTGQAFGG